MQSTHVEVLILNGLRKRGFYKVVIYVGQKILVGFEGRRDGGAWLSGARRDPLPQ